MPEEIGTVVLLQIPIALYWRATAHTDALTREFELLAASPVDDRPVPKQLTALMTQLLARYGSNDDGARQAVLQATERGDTEVSVEFTMPVSFRSVGPQAIEMWDAADAFCRDGTDLLTLAAPPDIAAFRRWFVEELMNQLAGGPPVPWPEYAATHLDEVDGPAPPKSGMAQKVSAEGFPVLIVTGQVDIETAPELRSALQRLRDTGATTVVVDAEAVEFLDSVGISVLIAVRERLADDGGGLIVRSPSRQVRRTLEMAGLADLFHLSN
jgi:anti-anti-sigma factor